MIDVVRSSEELAKSRRVFYTSKARFFDVGDECETFVFRVEFDCVHSIVACCITDKLTTVPMSKWIKPE